MGRLPGNEYLIIAVVVGVVLRGRVAQSKGETERSSFTESHGEVPRRNRPGTDH